MANPTTLVVPTGDPGQPATLEATSTQQSVIIEPGREYSLTHLSLATDGSSAAVGIIKWGVTKLGETAPTLTADLAAGANQGVLKSDQSCVCGPDAEKLHFLSLSGSPTFEVNPGPNLRGDH